MSARGESGPRKIKKRYIFLKEISAALAGLLAYGIYITFIANKQAPIVNTSLGKISGIVGTSRGGREFYQYLGIPYAQPPVGKLRFESPQPPLPWKGVRDGSRAGPLCLQIDLLPKERLGSEDCLYLNVLAPKIRGVETGELLPVMVFIHGGGFQSGRTDIFGNHFWMDENVILVTLHYRLGVFGFLNTGDKNARGNQGLKDQNMALQWIQENIHEFGGNPRQVTLFGNSAGAASVHFHTLSPKSKGLFSKGISQSGSALLIYVHNNAIKQKVQTLSEQTKCPLTTTFQFVQCLKQLDGVELVELQRYLQDPPRNPDTMFLPSRELVDDDEAFLAHDPIEIMKNGSFNRVPLILGINSEEGLLFSAELLHRSHHYDSFAQDWNKFIPNHLNIPRNDTLLEEIRDFYFDKSSEFSLNASSVNVPVLLSYTKMFSDRVFFSSLHVAARLQSQYSPVYVYYLTHTSEISVIDVMKAVRAENSHTIYEFVVLFVKNWLYRNVLGWDPRFPGVGHAEELLLQFSALPHLMYPSSSPDYLFSHSFLRTWVEFGIDDKTMTFRNVSWPPVNPNDDMPLYMNLNVTNPGIILEPFHSRVKFWLSHGIF